MADHHHILRRFDEELEEVRHRVMVMGGKVEAQLKEALHALFRGDRHLAQEVIGRDQEVDRLEVEIDDLCARIIAKRQPAASDLRFLLATIKVITDLERIGDEACRIARFALDLSQQAPAKEKLLQLEQLATLVRQMLHDALDAFARVDLQLALEVLRRDQGIDRGYEEIVRQQVAALMEHPQTTPIALDLMWVARALERIGDHCCNLAEHLIYFAKGRDVRHKSLEELTREIKGDK